MSSATERTHSTASRVLERERRENSFHLIELMVRTSQMGCSRLLAFAAACALVRLAGARTCVQGFDGEDLETTEVRGGARGRMIGQRPDVGVVSCRRAWRRQ